MIVIGNIEVSLMTGHIDGSDVTEVREYFGLTIFWYGL